MASENAAAGAPLRRGAVFEYEVFTLPMFAEIQAVGKVDEALRRQSPLCVLAHIMDAIQKDAAALHLTWHLDPSVKYVAQSVQYMLKDTYVRTFFDNAASISVDFSAVPAVRHLLRELSQSPQTRRTVHITGIPSLPSEQLCAYDVLTLSMTTQLPSVRHTPERRKMRERGGTAPAMFGDEAVSSMSSCDSIADLSWMYLSNIEDSSLLTSRLTGAECEEAGGGDEDLLLAGDFSASAAGTLDAYRQVRAALREHVESSHEAYLQACHERYLSDPDSMLGIAQDFVARMQREEEEEEGGETAATVGDEEVAAMEDSRTKLSAGWRQVLQSEPCNSDAWLGAKHNLELLHTVPRVLSLLSHLDGSAFPRSWSAQDWWETLTLQESMACIARALMTQWPGVTSCMLHIPEDWAVQHMTRLEGSGEGLGCQVGIVHM